jgi:hypothetical protein
MYINILYIIYIHIVYIYTQMFILYYIYIHLMIRGYWYRVPLRRRWLLLGASTEEVAGYRQPAIAIFSVQKMDVLEHPSAVDWSQAHTTMRFARLPLLGLPRGMWWKSQSQMGWSRLGYQKLRDSEGLPISWHIG